MTATKPDLATATDLEVGAGTEERRHGLRLGVILTVLSAAAFGASGSLAKSLLDLGWTPAALVAVRLGGAAVVLAVPAYLSARARWRPTRRDVGRLVLYGVVATGGAQFCFFSAVRYLPIGTAILLEFTAPIWLIAIYALRTRRRPSGWTLVAAGLAVIGMALVLDVLHAGSIDVRGLAWGLAAAACLCGYYLLSEGGAESDRGASAGEAAGRSRAGTPPLVVVATGTGIGALMILGAGLVGLLPLHAVAGRAELAGASVSWWFPLMLLILIPTVVAYALGILGVRRLGGAAASFVGLAEVLFSVSFSIVLVGQLPGPVQLVGMALVVAGIAVAQRSAAAAR